MRAADIIRGVLDMLDNADRPIHAQGTIVLGPKPDSEVEQQDPVDDSELVRMKQIAGLLDNDPPGQYENEPNEKYAGVDSVISGGDDVHKEKNPADIRTNAPSMFPGFQARM